MIVVTSVEPAKAADDFCLATICDLINDAYETSERGLWRPGYTRTTIEETASAVDNGEMRVAFVDSRIAGAVRTKDLDDTTQWFGALAVDPAYAGMGVGTALVAHVHDTATDDGRARVQLELLAPKPRHPHTDRLARWYRLLGYRPTARHDFAAVDPGTAGYLMRPCDLLICHRPLGAPSRGHQTPHRNSP